MSIKRYNEYLIAILGTALPLLILGTMAWNLIPHGGQYTPPGVTVHPAPGTPSHPKSPQRLTLCLPASVTDSDWQYVPLTSTLAKEEHNAHIGSFSAMALRSSIAYDSAGPNGLDGCDGLRDRQHSVIFNVLIRNSRTGVQRLLLKEPAVVTSLSMPTPKCASGEGDVPCGTLIWTLIDQDTNHDGVINALDTRHLYLSDLTGQNLRALSPEGAQALRWQWDSHSKELFISVRRDTNGDGQYTEEDGTELLVARGDPLAPAAPVIDATILKLLEGALH
jgi:hypothetical protein